MPSPIQIGLGSLMIEDQHQVIVLLWKEILSLGEGKSRVFVARSSVEVESRAMAQSVCEFLYLQRLLE